MSLYRYIFGTLSQDLVFEDEKVFLDYERLQTYNLVARFIIVWHVFNYLISNHNPTLANRIGFAIGFIYFVIKAQYANKMLPATVIRYLFTFEFFIYIVLYTLYNIEDPISCVVNNTILVISSRTVTSNIPCNTLVIITAIVFNRASFNRTQRETNDLLKLVTFYLFIIIDSHIRRKSTSNFVNDSMQRKKKIQKDISTTIFVASITHDLKNPLNSIMGCIDELKSSPNITSSEKVILLTASYSVSIMLYLIGNIHDISKISCGKFEIDRFPMNIVKEVKKVKKIERELVKLKGIKLYSKIIKPLPHYVYGDPMRFEQILINLLSNSIKFTNKGYVAILLNWVNNLDEIVDEEPFPPPEDFFNKEKKRNSIFDAENFHDTFEYIEHGTIEYQMQKYKRIGVLGKNNKNLLESNSETTTNLKSIEALARPKDQSKYEAKGETVKDCIKDSGLLVLDIIDTGIGISSEGVQKLFQPFSQANKDIRKQFGGTGLGLWITKELVTAMNGFIEVNSEVRRGSRFRIIIPFTICTAEDLQSDSDNYDQTNGLPFNSNYIRTGKKIIFKGKGKLLNEMKLLVLEDDSVPDNKKLEQFYKLIARDKCEVTYCSYAGVTENCKFDITSVDVIFAIASTVTVSTKVVITKLFKYIMDNDIKPIPLCVATGIFKVNVDIAAQGEFAGLTDAIITYPLEESALLKLLMRAKMRNDKKEFITKDYRKLISELCKNGVKVYDPEKVKRIILADDDATCQVVLKSMIEKMGDYKVFSFYNGQEALKCYEDKKEDIDIVILDYVMPEMTGIEVARQIRDFERRIQKSPVYILCLTGHDEPQIINDCVVAGIDKVLTKPIEKQKLMQVLKKL